MMPLVIGLAALILIVFSLFRLDNAVSRLLAVVAGLSLLVALGTWFVSEYWWANTTDCREAFPDQFGYRPPNWESAPPGELADVRVWWPIGHECRGTDVDTGESVVGKPGWRTTMTIYPAVGVMALSVSAIGVREYARRRTMLRS